MTHNTIEQDLNKFGLAEFLSKEGRTSVTLTDRRYYAICPCCQPPLGRSLQVSVNQQGWSCNLCQSTGDPVEFVMRRDNISRSQALRKMGRVLGIVDHNDLSSSTGWHMEHPKFPDQRDNAPLGNNIYTRRNYISQVRPPGQASDKIPGGRGNLALNNLAFPRAVIANWFSSFPRCFTHPGILVALYDNLQAHGKLQYPDLTTGIFDRTDLYDAGSIFWPKGAYAILKDLRNQNKHYPETEIKGITSRGFCLVKPPDLDNYYWMAPREPRKNGLDRRTFIEEGKRVLCLESIIIDPTQMNSYIDLTGEQVFLEKPQYGSTEYPRL